MVSFGKSKSKAKSTSTQETIFPKKFLQEALGFFPEPEFEPKFTPLTANIEDFEKSLFSSEADKLTEAYNRARALRREELSQSGLINSPAAFGEGGALDILDKDQARALGLAGHRARIARTGIEQAEAARRTGFDVDTAKEVMDIFFRKLAVALGAAGKTGTEVTTGRQSGFGFNFNPRISANLSGLFGGASTPTG